MIEIFHNSSGSSTRARNRTPRWRSIFIVLIVALCLGSAGQRSYVHAAPLYSDASIKVTGPKTVCAGQKAYYSAAVLVTLQIDKGRKPDIKFEMLGIMVEASSSNEGVADFLKKSQRAGSAEELVNLVTGKAEPSAAAFTLKAKKEGDTTIWFEAFGEDVGYATSPMMQVKVVNCKFKATTIHSWKIPGQAQGYVGATSNDADVKAADPESPFTGSTSVNWVATVGRVRDCSGVATVGSSKLDWNGTMNDSDQLTLDGNFQTAAGTFDIKCAGGGESFSESMPFEFTPDPVRLTISSSGGTVNQSQTLEWEGANPGQITIVIFPVEDTAVALIPGLHAVSWDDFSSLFGALVHLP